MKAYSCCFTFNKLKDIYSLVKHFRVPKFHSFCIANQEPIERNKDIIWININSFEYVWSDKYLEIKTCFFASGICNAIDKVGQIFLLNEREEGMIVTKRFFNVDPPLALNYFICKIIGIPIWSKDFHWE